jgi:hypothetical protein
MSPHDRFGLEDQDDALERGFFDVSIKPVILRLWDYRRVIVAATVLVFFAYSAGATFVFLRQPITRTSSLPFRLIFDGASAGKYPSGARFSPADLVASPVIASVFDQNKLSSYMDLDSFGGSLFVLESSTEAEILNHEYRAKLADTRLTAVDRARIEQEYRNKLQSVQPGYALTFVNPAGWRVPSIVVAKTLNDVLATWAKQAEDLRGVLKYQTALLTAAIMSEETDDRSLIRRTDVLRHKIRRLNGNIQQLETLPGAMVVKSKGGVSLPEIRVNLEDLVQHDLEPLYAVASASGTDSDVALRYLDAQLDRTKRDYQEALGKQQAHTASLQSYLNDSTESSAAAALRQSGGGGQGGQTAVVPQLSDTFLDRIMALSRQGEDLEFRQRMAELIRDSGMTAAALEKEQAFYARIIALMRAGSGRNNEASVAAVASSLDRSRKAALKAAGEVQEIYNTLSAHNLNPRAQLYTITGPPTHTALRSLTIRTVAMYGVLALLVTPVLVAMFCLTHLFIQREILARRGNPRPDDTAKSISGPVHR